MNPILKEIRALCGLSLFGLICFIFIMLIIKRKEIGGFGMFILYLFLYVFISEVTFFSITGMVESRFEIFAISIMAYIFILIGILNIGSFILLLKTRKKKYLSAFSALIGILVLESLLFLPLALETSGREGLPIMVTTAVASIMLALITSINWRKIMYG